MCALLHWEPNYEKQTEKRKPAENYKKRKKKNGMDFRGITFYGE